MNPIDVLAAKQFMPPHELILTFLCAVHLTEKSFKCTECKYSTTTRKRLLQHEKTVHAEFRKPFICEICGARLGYHESYKEHMRRHTGDKPHQCQTCGAAFVSESKNSQCSTVKNMIETEERTVPLF